MNDLLACRVCLATEDVKLFNIYKYDYNKLFESLTGFMVSTTDGLPQHLCHYCGYLMQKCSSFVNKCKLSQQLLAFALNQCVQLTTQDLSVLDTKKLKYSYSIKSTSQIDVTDQNNSSDNLIKIENTEVSDNDNFLQSDNYQSDDEPLLEIVKKKKKRNKTSNKTCKSDDLLEGNKDNDKFEALQSKTHLKKNRRVSALKKYINIKQLIEETDFKQEETIDDGLVDNDELELNLKHELGKKITMKYVGNIESINDNHCYEKEIEDCEILEYVDLVFKTKDEQIWEVQERQYSQNYLNSMYKCVMCFKGFISQTTFKNHMDRHDTKAGEFSCEFCHLRYDELRTLRSHLLLHRRRYICKTCSHATTSINRAKQHIMWHKGYSYKCDKCDAQFSKPTTYLSHIRIHHPSGNTCDICGESFIGNGLKMHQKRAHKGYKKNLKTTCPKCLVQFVNEEVLKKHSEDCDPNLMACLQCGLAFQSLNLLKEHTKNEHQSPVVCNVCQDPFPNDRLLLAHYKNRHSKMSNVKKSKKKSGSQFICETCGQTCVSKTTLVYHMRTHTGERPYQCSTCSKRFGTQQRLQVHIRTHTGESPFQCTSCPKAFKHKAALNRHVRVHTGAKPYTCSYCGRSFSQSNSMKMHVRTIHLNMPALYRKKARPHLAGDKPAPDAVLIKGV